MKKFAMKRQMHIRLSLVYVFVKILICFTFTNCRLKPKR